MKFGSLFAGAGGFDLGFERAGMECAWQVEIDDKCQETLAQHWPNVPKYKDVTEFDYDKSRTVDLICGGFPCQDISLAGRRAGLAGERSGLWFTFLGIIKSYKPRWVVIENVPGLLSSNGGQDLAVIFRGLAKCGYMGGYRVLDSQYFGVPQRRRRVFIIGHLRNGSAAQVLFESQSLSRDIAQGRKAGKDIAGTLAARTRGGGFPGTDGATSGHVIPDPAFSLRNSTGIYDGDRTTMVIEPNPAYSLTAHQTRLGEANQTYVMGFHVNKSGHLSTENISKALRSNASHSYQGVSEFSGVRRLTPLECERLQGFPDNWTALHSDTHRYRMMGNAVTVPVAEWLGRRIMEADHVH